MTPGQIFRRHDKWRFYNDKHNRKLKQLPKFRITYEELWDLGAVKRTENIRPKRRRLGAIDYVHPATQVPTNLGVKNEPCAVCARPLDLVDLDEEMTDDDEQK